MPEVVGPSTNSGQAAGLMVDPTDVQALSAALARVLNDDTLRAEMCAKSLAHARQFTWQKTAARTMETYAKISE